MSFSAALRRMPPLPSRRPSGVSGERTALIFSFSLIGVCMILYRSLREEKRVGLPAKGVFSALLCAACIYQTYSLWEMWI